MSDRKTLKNVTVLLLAIGLLAAMAVASLHRASPADAEPYHAAVREAIALVPFEVGDWVGTDVPAPQAATKLLKPNAMFTREFVNTKTGRKVTLLVVHCRDARDLVGHYPKVCYPAHGWQKNWAEKRQWPVGEQVIPGMEYAFSIRTTSTISAIRVRNFFVVRGDDIHRDMDGVRKAEEDRQRRFYGAAQIQLVTDGEMSDEQRNNVFSQLVGQSVPVIETLRYGRIQ